jgi:hypothetical protein
MNIVKPFKRECFFFGLPKSLTYYYSEVIQNGKIYKIKLFCLILFTRFFLYMPFRIKSFFDLSCALYIQSVAFVQLPYYIEFGCTPKKLPDNSVISKWNCVDRITLSVLSSDICMYQTSVFIFIILRKNLL